MKISAELSHVCPLVDVGLHARVLEERKFHRIWVPDTIVSAWEYWVATTLVVENTRQSQVGLGVTNPYARSPVVLAQALATLNNLSGGRISLALGKGNPRFLEKAGLKQHESALQEAIHIIRGLVRGERVSFRGEVFQIDGMLLRTLPCAPSIPVYLAAVSERSWHLAAKLADGISTLLTDDLPAKIEKCRQGNVLPVAVLVPFSVKRKDFFRQAPSSPGKLAEIIGRLESWGVDELILAYADLEDLDALSSVLS
jgi:alkanesulfonate monooxygenase SsuD/methylene tetrahydromethanopterin reductase-like flavin-dependent oxidoreductase (luciferase family)